MLQPDEGGHESLNGETDDESHLTLTEQTDEKNSRNRGQGLPFTPPRVCKIR